jgi:DNA-binding CsgD family transcriptional regulator
VQNRATRGLSATTRPDATRGPSIGLLPQYGLLVSVSTVRLTVPPARERRTDSRVVAHTDRADTQHDAVRWLLRANGCELAVVSSTVVGRGVGVDIQLDDCSVSRRHARLRLSTSGPIVEDLASRNGTRVNGHLITAPTQLVAGDRVALGDSEFEVANTQLRRRAIDAARTTQPMTGSACTTVATAPTLVTDGSALSVLSPRERIVFPLLARGLSQRDIAAHCGVTVKTVETYRTRISHKLGLRTRAELVRFALETGVLRPNIRN